MSAVLGELMKRGIDLTLGKMQPFAEKVEIVPGVGKDHLAARWSKVIPITASQITDAAGTTLIIPNPIKRSCMLTRIAIAISAASANTAARLDVGATSLASPANNDLLIDGLNTNVLGAYDNIGNGGTNGQKVLFLKANEGIIFRRSAGTEANFADLEGFVLFEYFPQV